ncbi:MAG TPA: ClpP-like prohead protease/major capsid protein fusion protein [Mizugakiibacter sp.]
MLDRLLSPHARVFLAFAMGAIAERPKILPLMVLRPCAAAANEAELLVYGDIGDSWWGESVTALSIVQQLQALGPEITQINVRVNSYGGSVSDGLAIYNALRRHSARKVVTVDGVAMSSASLIAMAGDEVRMPSASLLMIHAPWGIAHGNAQDMRLMADVLDTYAEAMANAYAAKSGKPRADMLALVTDGQDHYYTGDQALADGFADVLVDPLADTGAGDAAAAARAAGVERLLGTASDPIRQLAIAAAARQPGALPAVQKPRLQVPQGIDMAALQQALASASGQRALVSALTTAASADDGELTMKLRKLFAALRDPATDPADAGRGAGGPATSTADAASPASIHAALRQRNDEIRAVLEPYKQRRGVSDLLVSALADPAMTVDAVRARALELVGRDATPSAAAVVTAGATDGEKVRDAAVSYLLARAGVLKVQDAQKARAGNPFNGMTLMDMARDFAARGGIIVQGRSRDEIIAAAITHSTSDFPNVLENALHKVVINAYNQVERTWDRFCRVGTLSDFRPHNRYALSSFSDLKPVKENGEYEDGTIADAEKETITGSSKGRIINLSREIIINDDMGVFTNIAVRLGQAAARTVEKDVYALLTAGGGVGPTMSDGKALFDAAHNNIAGTAAAPGVDSFDAARVLMASQKDPGGNDFIGIRPAVWLGPVSLGGSARVTNDSQYDPDAASKLQRANKVRGLVADVVDTPRLSGTAWYLLADPSLEPVIEVAFLDGIQVPMVVADDSFRSNGRAWRVTFDYGVGAVGFRGIVKNAGA